MDKKVESKKEKITFPRIALLAVGCVVLWWLLHNLDLVVQALASVRQLIYPIIAGGIMAFLLNIPMNFFERKIFRGRGKRFQRPVCLLLSTVVVLFIIFAAINLLIPNIIDAVSQLIARLPEYIEQLEQVVGPYLEEYLPSAQAWLEENGDLLTGLLNELAQYLQSLGGALFSSTFSVATSVFGQIIQMLISFVLMCHLLLGKEKLLAQANGILMAYLPGKQYDRVRQLSTLTYRSYSGFASGLCIEALMEGILFFIVLTIGGFDYALLISIIMAFAALIPILGAWIGAIFGALLLLISMGPSRMLAFIIISLVVQQIGSNVLYPKVIGQSIGLPTIWTLAAVAIGSGLGGVFGILFFIPMFSVIYTIIRQHTVATLVKKGIRNSASSLKAEAQNE